MRKALVALAGACAMWAGSAQAGTFVLEPDSVVRFDFGFRDIRFEWLDRSLSGAQSQYFVFVFMMASSGHGCDGSPECYEPFPAYGLGEFTASPSQSPKIVAVGAYGGGPGYIEFTSRSGYTEITIDGFEAPQAVPEPATWAMMIAGFGLVGAAARHSTRRSTRQAFSTYS